MGDSVRGAFGQAFPVKTREELDGWNSSLYKDFYEKAADRFNDKEWIPNSLVLPDLHEDFKQSKPIPLNVTPIMPQQFKKRLSDNRYKMVKVIADWERSGSGSGMARNLLQGQSDDDDNSAGNSENQTSEQEVYEFWDGDDRKSFLRERPSHILHLWQLAYKYDILNTVRQQLRNEFTADGSSTPDVGSVQNGSLLPVQMIHLLLQMDYPTIYSKLLHLLMDWWVWHDKANKHRKFKCYMSIEKSWRTQSNI